MISEFRRGTKKLGLKIHHGSVAVLHHECLEMLFLDSKILRESELVLVVKLHTPDFCCEVRLLRTGNFVLRAQL